MSRGAPAGSHAVCGRLALCANSQTSAAVLTTSTQNKLLYLQRLVLTSASASIAYHKIYLSRARDRACRRRRCHVCTLHGCRLDLPLSSLPSEPPLEASNLRPQSPFCLSTGSTPYSARKYNGQITWVCRGTSLPPLAWVASVMMFL